MKEIIITFLVFLIFISGCTQNKTTNSQLPNPASVYCKEQGGELEIRTAPDGSQSGYCIFENSECPQWEYFRGECEK